jgi:3-hydroxybutyryl-CoA dehydrogenase
MQVQDSPVLIVGAGIMGAGIAQVAAQAGHAVMLFDARAGAAHEAKTKLAVTFEGLVAKGKLSAAQAQSTLGRIAPIDALDAAANAQLVIEAIVEKLDAKRALFQQLEGIVGERAILATNTSSISVTAIANGLQHPGRLAGMHFFNPVPLMKLVEVVSGLHTDPGVADRLFKLSQAWGKTPVHCKSTPGFIVNRIARPFYAEALVLLQEQAAEPAVIDACIKAAGFRMGPCELMDLIGHDTNFAVTNSVYEANFYDKRFMPSLVQRELVDGGLLGRKSGRGFYRYPEGLPQLPTPLHEAPHTAREITVHGDGPLADALEAATARALAAQGWGPARERHGGWTGLLIHDERLDARLVLTDGRTAHELTGPMHCQDVAVFDRPINTAALQGTTLAYACAPGASVLWQQQAPAWLAALGLVPLELQDTPGLVVARTIAMLINEAADAVQQGVCSAEGADAAMKLGVNYPAGPFEWLQGWSAQGVVALLSALDAHYRGERYRASPWLQRRAV